MDKIIKTLVFCFLCSSSLLSWSQTWHTLSANNFHPFVFWSGGGYPAKQFKISPFDNSIWLVKDTNIFQINGNGQFSVFNTSNEPLLDYTYILNDIAVTPNRVVFSDEFYGLYSYNGSSWTTIPGGIDGIALSSDMDTVWCSRTNQPYLKSHPSGIEFGPVSYFRRYVSKNGVYWGCSSSSEGNLLKLNGTTPVWYLADTCGLLDDKNYHFKFSNFSDTLYTSGDTGISLAVGDLFVDSICPSNCTNMPSLPIMEFEIDSNHNIWAIFGATTGLHSSQKIGFFDRNLNSWTQFFDESNSPITIPTTGGAGIELDTLGNLWVLNGSKLHMLTLGNEPEWLGVSEQSIESNLSIFPNPSNKSLTIQNSSNIDIIEIIDLQGRLIKSIEVNSENYNLDILDLENGQYILNVINGNKIERKNFVKQ